MKAIVIIFCSLILIGIVFFLFKVAKEPYNNNNKYPVLYINLDHRIDRKEQLEYEFDKMDITNYHRINAIKNEKGYVGCSQSHIACLIYAKKMGYPQVIIFEDDFQFLISRHEFRELLDHLSTVDYNVMMLSYNSPSDYITEIGDPLLLRIRDAQTASGYIVSQKYYDTLITNFKEGLEKLLETDDFESYAVDMYWKQLQEKDIWFCYHKRVGKQRESYSDIQNENVDYGL